eukprot:GEMP01006125.1.p1 GENE.GEMP01006125.1~~GEMP01006125.1.p1  ORF type:complete len:408 (+),score=81.68 GEMP01006125.1:213-1436(+)
MGAILSAPVDSIVVERAGCSKLRCAVATMQGWRCSHEDSHVMVQPLASDGESSKNAPFLLSVMDGHGGDEVAHEMYKLLPQQIDVATLPKITDTSFASVVKERFKKADAYLRKRIPEQCSAGATCTSALFAQSEENKDKWNIALANAGDSRAIVIHQDATFTATEDHKPDNPEETARIEKAGGFVTKEENAGPARVDSNLAVSRAFGDFAYKDRAAIPEDQKISCVPDVTIVTAKDGDFILLCCDGIFDVMSNEECVEFVLKHDHADLGFLCSDLLKHVLEKGSKDNCSAMICHLGSVEKHKEDDIAQTSTTLDRSKWHGFHDGYMTSMLIPGAIPPDDESVKEKFIAFHRAYGFSDPLPSPCSNCKNIYLGMQVCSRCRKTQYCSFFCQKKDWKGKHKELCNTKSK